MTPATRGHLLLIENARQRASRRHLRGNGANLGAMTEIPSACFASRAAGIDVVQIDDAVNPHAVLSRIKAAGRNPGPVVVYVSGLLMYDRTGALHLGLRDSTSRSVRYDGLPWEWLVNALRSRPRRETLVIADFATDTHSWARLRTDVSVLTNSLPVWGVVNPPIKAADGTSPFTRALSVVLPRGIPRVPAEVHPGDIHRAVVERAGLAVGTIELVPDSPGLLLRNVHPGAPPADVDRAPVTVAEAPVELLLATSDPTAYQGELARIRSAGEHGDHTAAVLLAQELDTRLLTALGVDHPDSWAAREVYAWASVAAGRYLQACELYRDVARRRMRAFAHTHASVVEPVDCAHAAWLRIPSGDDARRVGPSIIALRELVPGRAHSALKAARRHLDHLQEDDPEVQMRRGPEAWSAYLGRQSRQSGQRPTTSLVKASDPAA
ncbi:hypothetical protein [Streptomyces sp. SID3343]|uniref:hypothetical protein n=1 Tax=Streptomyces sp. SID3343 TaxID=2690260 RepID=UPI00136B2E25|nr:hypothetical protein [Streptomyces sp. SID3343]MYW01822.1 hypothetical protein [Streptomyces sp. SID3343]